MSEKMLYWYIVIWSNNNLKGKCKPLKVGEIIGLGHRQPNNERICLNKKTKDFEIAEKYLLICRATKEQFKGFLETGKVKQ